MFKSISILSTLLVASASWGASIQDQVTDLTQRLGRLTDTQTLVTLRAETQSDVVRAVDEALKLLVTGLDADSAAQIIKSVSNLLIALGDPYTDPEAQPRQRGALQERVVQAIGFALRSVPADLIPAGRFGTTARRNAAFASIGKQLEAAVEANAVAVTPIVGSLSRVEPVRNFSGNRTLVNLYRILGLVAALQPYPIPFDVIGLLDRNITADSALWSFGAWLAFTQYVVSNHSANYGMKLGRAVQGIEAKLRQKTCGASFKN